MLAAAAAAFVTIFFAELGDKTQLVSMTLACRYPPLQVLAGAMCALGVVIGLAVVAGGFISAAMPHSLLAGISGLVFVGFGILTYSRRDDTAPADGGRSGFLQAMVMVFIAEFGDKTQIAALLLAASLGYPGAVFAGAMAAMLANHLLAVYLGSRLLIRLDARIRRVISASFFIAVGVFLILNESLPL